MNTVPRDFLYQRPTTVESIHRTSIASSLEDVNDINKINYSVGRLNITVIFCFVSPKNNVIIVRVS